MASNSFSSAMRSTIAKKFLMAITGIGLVLFVISHLLGNLTLLFGGSDAFNLYTYKLFSLGPFLYAIEAGLLLFFLVHIWNGISVSRQNRAARKSRYRKTDYAGGPSKKSTSSLSMIITGLVLMVFLVVHISTFKYGPYYLTTVDGVQMRDLYRLVVEKFADPLYAFGYMAVMILLGLHLRHGFWSAFQSLGANHPRYSSLIYSSGVVIAVLLAVGFAVIPFVLYLTA